MAPLPSPEERRKRLQSISLDDILGRSRRTNSSQTQQSSSNYPRKPLSPAAEEREQQRREAFRRSKSGNPN